MNVYNLKVVNIHKKCCILPNDLQIANEGWFFASVSQYKLYGILWLTQNIVTEMKNKAHIQKLWEMLIYETLIRQMRKTRIYYLSMCLLQFKKGQILIVER